MGPIPLSEAELPEKERPVNGARKARDTSDFALAINNISVESASPLPMYEQITLALRSAVCAGDLPAGSLLPTSRDLARFLGVSRNTVGLAYSRLVAEGYLVSHRGRGTHVAQNGAALFAAGQLRPVTTTLSVRTSTARKEGIGTIDRASDFLAEPVRHAGDVCSPDSSLYPRMSLGRLLAQEFGKPPSSIASPLMVFQATMASHLRQTRGVRCQPEQIIPLANCQCALELIAHVLIDPGHCVHIEDPIASSIRATFQRAGAWISPLTTENPAGALDGAPPRLFVVSPSNNIPLGTQMSVDRRLAILSAAKQARAIVLEFDRGYDLIFAGSRGPAMQALGGEDHVIYFGSLYETLGPYIQLAYLVVPPDLVEPFCRTAAQRGYNADAFVLAALAAFIGDTKYTVHLRALRGIYGERAVLLAETCRSRFGVGSMVQPVGGLCAMLRLPADANEPKLCQAARSQGIALAPLAHFYQARSPFPGVVFGLGSLPERVIGATLGRFAELVQETSK